MLTVIVVSNVLALVLNMRLSIKSDGMMDTGTTLNAFMGEVVTKRRDRVALRRVLGLSAERRSKTR
jgi:hypothetical protein